MTVSASETAPRSRSIPLARLERYSPPSMRPHGSSPNSLCDLLMRQCRFLSRRLDENLDSSMLVTAAALLLSAGSVYWACEYFVNGIEWFGRKAGISQNAVGTVLAAFGTALPESVVTFVAVAFGHDAAAKDIGVGAALGGPLVLATVAYPIVGIMLLITRSQPPHRPIELNRRRLGRDQGWFLLIFAFKIALGFLAFAIKPWLGWLFLAAYIAYTYSEMRHEGDAPEGELEPLKFQRAGDPSWTMTALQTVLSVVVIFVASRVFVGQLGAVG